MHFDDGLIPEDYRRYLARKRLAIALGLVVLVIVLVVAVASGAASIPVGEVLGSLLGREGSARTHAIVWHIRLPQAVAALIAGAGLAAAGTVMQAILRNPLGSPFTLGIAHAAAFGAALSVVLLGEQALTVTSPHVTAASAFVFSLITALVIIGIARRRGATPEVMVLAGVAIGSLFTAGTMFLQYFADDMQLAAMVFWTFGDTARASWADCGLLAVVTVACALVFGANAWNYNAIDAGEETASSLGVRVAWVRTTGMLLASLLTAATIAVLGIIGFVGLVAPHMARRILGADHRYLLPGSMVLGSLLLLGADTVARQVLAPRVLPVSVLMAFLGAPVFLALILRGRWR